MKKYGIPKIFSRLRRDTKFRLKRKTEFRLPVLDGIPRDGISAELIFEKDGIIIPPEVKNGLPWKPYLKGSEGKNFSTHVGLWVPTFQAGGIKNSLEV